MKTDIDYLIRTFGSAAEVARAAGVTRGAVSRWREGRTISDTYQANLIEEAKKRGGSSKLVQKVAMASGVERCPGCGFIHSPKLRRILP